MTEDKEYFGMFLDSIDRMARRGLVPSIPALDLDPDAGGGIDLSSLLEEVGILGLCRGGSEFSDLPSILGAVSRLSEYCAGIGAYASYRLAADMFLKLAGMDCPAGTLALCIFDDEEPDLSFRRTPFKALLSEDKLTGRKKSVVLGGYGGPYAVLAQDGGHPVLCLVDHDGRTVSVEGAGLLGARLLRVADVAFSKARPSSVKPVSREEVLALFSVLSLLTGACACATAAKSLDIAREYARGRYQGGDLIEEHDAVKLMIEGNRATLDAAHAALLGSSELFEPGNAGSMAACFRAKAAASAAAVNAGLDAIQVHGGYGYMRDYGVEKRFRDAATLSVLPLDATRLLLLGNTLTD